MSDDGYPNTLMVTVALDTATARQLVADATEEQRAQLGDLLLQGAKRLFGGDIERCEHDGPPPYYVPRTMHPYFCGRKDS